MSDKSQFATVLESLHDNQIALGAAIEEIALWIDAQGSNEVADNIRGSLTALDANAKVISNGISILR